MTETRIRLAAECVGQSEAIELVQQSRDLEQVVDRCLAECQRCLERGGATTEEPIQRLAGLLRLARRALALRAEGAELDGGRSVMRDMCASGSAGEAESLVGALLAEPDRSSGRVMVDGTLLAEVFGALSRLCHKINNPLTSIMGRSQILQLQVPATGEEKLRKSVEVIEESCKRVAALVQELASLLCQARKEFVERYDSSRGCR